MEESINTFSYEPLDVGNKEIRILNLEPAASFDDKIRCRIFHATLEEHPSYEALSYFWGDATITAPILLHQQTFQVTANLESALRHLREANTERILWVDAICINQLDLEERRTQVTVMEKIYQSASCTVMWLGPGSALNPETLALCQMTLPPNYLEAKEQINTQLLALNKPTFEMVLGQFCHIMSGNEVWKRIWVAQEVTFAEDLVLLYGFQRLSWWSLFCLYVCLTHRGAVPNQDALELMAGYEINLTIIIRRVIHRIHGLGPKTPILRTYKDLGSLNATDPRDYIYALLSLSTDGPLLGITPDYTISKEDLIRKVVRSHITMYCKLDFLELCSIRFLKTGLETSWIAGIGDGKFNDIPLDDNDATYQASWCGRNNSWASVRIQSDPKKLTLSGVLLNTVRVVTDTTWQPRGTPQSTRGMFLETMPTVPSRIYVNGENNLDAYWRTLMYDSVRGEYRRIDQDDIVRFREAFNDIMITYGTVEVQYDASKFDLESTKRHIMNSFGSAGRKFNFGLTSSGYMAMFPECTQEGDIVAVLYGGRVPFILRSHPENEGEYFVVGPAYVHGFMGGEAMTWRDEGRLKGQVFTLI